MANLSVPAPGRIAVGYVMVNGQKLEVFLDPEWGRYFDSLNTQVVVTSQTAPVAGPPGPQGATGTTGATGATGAQGAPGPALFMLQEPENNDVFWPIKNT